MVLVYHFFEAYAPSVYGQRVNHGYLAVHFFFILSGFVLGYAYEGRWDRMSVGEFIKRRVIRLHPMVVIGVLLGVIAYLVQGSVMWDGTAVPLTTVLLAALATLFLIPASPGSQIDVRGFGELFPLNGPFWSLFLEYIGSILYGLILRRLSTKALGIIALVTGAGVALYAVGNGSGFGHLGIGWTMAEGYLWAGLLCMTFSFTMGMLISRVSHKRPLRVRGAFWWCALVLVTMVSVPHFGEGQEWINGLYDALCVLLVSPLLVWIGASSSLTDRHSEAVAHFWGHISYPVYMIHYPSMYLFYNWVWSNEIPYAKGLPVGIGIIVANILLAYLLYRYYDVPTRAHLSRRLVKH